MIDTLRHSKSVPALSCLWLLAFLCSLYPVNEWQLELFGGCVALMLAWAFFMFSRRMSEPYPAVAIDIKRTPVLMAAAAFWVLVVASIFWSQVKPISLMGVCFFSVMPLTFFAGAASGDVRYFKMTAKVLAGIFAVLSIWAIVQFFFLNTYFLGQARHPLADPGSLGGLFSLALFCAMGWMTIAKTQKEKVMATSLAALLLCGILSTVARGPIFAAVPGLAVFAILLWPFVRARWRLFGILLIAAAAFFALMQTGAPKKYDLATRIAETAVHTPGNPDGTSNRLKVWETTAEMIRDRPWTGSGIGTFYLRYPQYQKPGDADGAYLAHNDPLQFWVELGILGPVLFYLFMIFAALRTFKALKRIKLDRSASPLADDPQASLKVILVSILAALVAMVAQSHVNFNLYNLSILMMAGFLLSVWYCASSKALAENAPPMAAPSTSPSLYKALLLLPFLMTGWLFTSVIAGDHFANRARDDLFAEQMFDFADNVNKADRVSMGLNFRTFLLAVNVPMSILQIDKDTKKPFDREHQEQLYNQVKRYMEKIIVLNPLEPGPYYYLGRVQQLVEKEVVPEGTPSPEEYFKKALALDPVYIQARLALYDVYEAEGKSKADLIAVLEPGADFNYATPVAADYYGRLARLYLETRDYAKTKEIMGKMAYFQKIDLYSRQRQASSIPQAIMGGDALMVKP